MNIYSHTTYKNIFLINTLILSDSGEVKHQNNRSQQAPLTFLLKYTEFLYIHKHDLNIWFTIIWVIMMIFQADSTKSKRGNNCTVSSSYILRLGII